MVYLLPSWLLLFYCHKGNNKDSRDMMVALKYLGLCLVIILSSCRPVVDEMLPTPMPTQAFLPRVSPEHGERISYDEYKARSEVDDLGIPLLGWPGPLCVYYDAQYVIEEPDVGLRMKDYISRSLLIVNGEIWPHSTKPDLAIDYLGLMGSWETGNGFGPYDFCWNVELGPGMHTIEFKTRTTSGKELSYTWSFVITE
jgi:hypothetical protein